MVVWAGQHRDWYPLPSMVDLSDTIPGIDSTRRPCGVPQQNAEMKDLPRWIVSLMIFNGSIPTETCVSPGEVNPRIQVNRVYEYANPSAVVLPKRSIALLDPAFACYPNEEGGGLPIASSLPFPPEAGFSYAILPPVGLLREEWKSTAGPARALLGNRGPWYRRNEHGSWVLDPDSLRGQPEIAAKDSNTLKFWGRSSDWTGNVVRNDGSVTFEIRPDPQNLTLSQSVNLAVEPAAQQSTDNLFVMEDERHWKNRMSLEDEIDGLWSCKNNFLRCYGGNGDSWHTSCSKPWPQVPSRIWFD